MGDTYRTIATSASVELRVKGSRFIGEAFPADSVDAASEHIFAVQQRERDATHHCWAYRIGRSGDTFRFNDDGEPSGTAGAPILRQIEGRHLVEVLVVVTRYYGGTKLGTGGLIRAYGDAAGSVLESAPVKECVVRSIFQLRFSYDDTSAAMQTLNRYDAEMLESEYGVDTRLMVAVRESQAEAFVSAFTDSLGGRGTVTPAAS